MKEIPMLFNDKMVQSILSGRKTQTRRFVTPPPVSDNHELRLLQDGQFYWCLKNGIQHSGPVKTRYGKAGDRIWVREAFATGLCTPDTMAYRATHKPSDLEEGWFEPIKWTPSIHMPRWACRTLLNITSVRAERLTDISREDALAEGMDDGSSEAAQQLGFYEKPQRAFRRLWEQIYGEVSWQNNPWVWVTTFELPDGAQYQSR